jgi:D-alanyl-D-alanine carboxypeptidase/D-alanyl-D-alanine-endopeptidase (penicillin-binding protein 4)
MKFFIKILILLIPVGACCQPVSEQLSAAINTLENDNQFKHAMISMYVVDSKTGNVVYEKNAQTGMAPASCQKVITSTTAFELLGKNYTYKTYIRAAGKIKNEKLTGDLYLMGCGDPTLGSWRWEQTKQENVLKKISSTLSSKKIKIIDGNIEVGNYFFSYNPIPDGWIWQDIGNYYGAGAWGFNWHENQYDLNLKSTGKINAATTIVSTVPVNLTNNIVNLVTSAAKGSGDKVYIYATPYNEHIFATGTMPINENKFKVSGSMPDPSLAFGKTMISFLQNEGVSLTGKLITNHFANFRALNQGMLLDSIVSPALDSINYWFLKKSINLYGEALVKTISLQQTMLGSTDTGLAIIKDFWSKRGIEKSALKIIDGSGLSPANRVTTNALVTVMQYAKKQSWFSSFYFDLPEINKIKMKDGYINGVRSYTGYIKSGTGSEYTFSLIVNNFDGNPGTVREKMWRVLNILK